MSRTRWSDTPISWLHPMTATVTFQHVRTPILTESYSNSGLRWRLRARYQRITSCLASPAPRHTPARPPELSLPSPVSCPEPLSRPGPPARNRGGAVRASCPGQARLVGEDDELGAVPRADL